MKRLLFIVFANVAVFCVLVVGLELLGQLTFFATRGYPLHESRWRAAVAAETTRLIEPHPFLVGRLRHNVRLEMNGTVVTTTDIGTRWTGARLDNPNAIGVAVLGGSTAFGTRVSDADSWPALLQTELGAEYAVTNYGAPGYTTAEGIIQMALLVPETNPRIVVIYEGWNDIRNYHNDELGPDYFSHGMDQYQSLDIPIRFTTDYESLVSRLSDVSAIMRLAERIAGALPRRIDSSAGVETARTPDPFVDAIYLRNLKTLKSLAREMGAYVIFVPQLINERNFRDESGSRSWSPRIENDALPILLARFNRIMADACLPEEPDCVVLDEVMVEDWVLEDFVDDGHFSRAGGQKLVAAIAKAIIESPR